MFDLRTTTLATVIAACVFSFAAYAEEDMAQGDAQPQVEVSHPHGEFGKAYQPIEPVGKDQAQIVYYRDAGATTDNGGAHVYVDHEFQTSLMPGGYTAFCVKPGTHTLGAYLKDEPYYKGKNSNARETELNGGETYFYKVDEKSQDAQVEITGPEATPELIHTREQINLLSRASAVVPCQHEYQDFVINSDVLFDFAKYARKNIKPGGIESVATIADQLKSKNTNITVVGHTDPIGSDRSNYTLGLRRAQTIRNILIEEGIPAEKINVESQGSKDLIGVNCSGLARSAKIACYAPERRVVIREFNQ